METVKTIVDPIFLICESVLKLSRSTGFPAADIKRILKCQESWKNIRSSLKSFASYYKQISDKEGDHGQILVSFMKNLNCVDDSTKALFSELLHMADLKEVSQENDSVLVENSNSKNITAMNVLLRIKSKLEGKSAEKRIMSVVDQVDHLIKSAISPENLSQMYEGWMSWI